nr:phosphodiester glycosidase family protein [Myxococcota bacterium]
ASGPTAPPDIAPLSARSAEPGDGVWKRLGDEGTSGGWLYTTTLHPHATSRFITVTLVSIDLTALQLGFMPGVEDVGKRKVPFVAGLVPADAQSRLVAAFNGGFMLRHGRWGMQLGETSLQAQRDPGCSIAIDGEGAVQIRSWPALAPEASRFLAIRQTPPCLVENGALHPLLLKGLDKAWAGNTAGVVTRRRSGIGIDRDGKRLLYAVGLEATPRLLAEALKAAGAEHAAELDINWNWTRFLIFDRNAEGALRVSKPLVEVEHSARVYVERASERDFFYVLRR